MFLIFKEHFMQTALLGGLVTGCFCAYLGVFILLKRVVFMGIALSEVAALGVALGLFIGVNPVISGFVLTLLGTVLFWAPFNEKNISKESFLGFVYAFCVAMAVILIAKNPAAEARGLNLISGNLLYAGWPDIKILGGVMFIVFVLHLVFFKEFIFVSFDRETAFTTGLKANILDFLLYLTIGVTIGLSMKICGVVFVFASLVIPAMVGLIFAKRTGIIFFVSLLVGASGVISGLICSYIYDLPSGPAIVGMYSLILLLSAGIKFLLNK